MAAYTLDTTLGQILADPKAKAVLDQHVPGISSNPMLTMVSGVSLRSLIAMPQAAQMGFTQDKVQAILDDINKMV
jgi:hypothetical protein